MKTMSVAEARADLSNCIREAERGDPVLITRHGKPVVALVPANDLDQLNRLRSAGPDAGLAGLVGGWEDSDDLVRQLETPQRSAPRATPDLD